MWSSHEERESVTRRYNCIASSPRGSRGALEGAWSASADSTNSELTPIRGIAKRLSDSSRGSLGWLSVGSEGPGGVFPCGSVSRFAGRQPKGPQGPSNRELSLDGGSSRQPSAQPTGPIIVCSPQGHRVRVIDGCFRALTDISFCAFLRTPLGTPGRTLGRTPRDPPVE